MSSQIGNYFNKGVGKSIIGEYVNGNYNVILLSDGTKIRYSNGSDEFGDVVSDDDFYAKFPENIDLKVSNWCNIGCPFCHEGSSANGEVADLRKYTAFFSSLMPGTELAIGGGMLSPLLDSSVPVNESIFMTTLFGLNQFGVIVNMTFNQHEIEDPKFRHALVSLSNIDAYPSIHGIGVSFNKQSNALLELRRKIKYSGNLVIHTIAGITSPEDYKWLAENRFKILILGYKKFRRGENFFLKNSSTVEKRIQWVKDNLTYLSNNCKSVSFDCLATEQLDLKNILSKEDWDRYYMGDDGKFTMYVDLVKGEYATNSTTSPEQRLKIPKSQDVAEMFRNIRELNKENK